MRYIPLFQLLSLILLIIFIIYLINSLLNNTHIQENYTGLSTNDLISTMKAMYIVDEQKKTVRASATSPEKSYAKHFNTVEAIALAKDKFRTSSTLIKNNIPVPKYMKVPINQNIDMITAEMNKENIYFPVVIKPINGTFGIDVITNIDNKTELKESLDKFIGKYDEVMLEEQVSGDCYRVFVFNGKVIDVIKREKPYIIGNGINTVTELIDKRNMEQRAMGLFETKNVSELFLAKQGYQRDTVLKDGEKVYISNVINMHNGARISRVDINTIPNININLFINTNKALNITCSGIDYMSDDITVPYKLNNKSNNLGFVLEVNGTPDTEIHTKIKYPTNTPNFWKRVANQIFE